MSKRYIRRVIIAIDICCITISAILLFQIMVQVKEGNQILSEKGEAYESALNFLQTSEKIQLDISKTYVEYCKAKEKYDVKLYIDAIAAELDRDFSRKDYIMKYFKINKEELQRLISKLNMGKKLEPRFMGVENLRELLPIGDGVWVRYEENDNLPSGLLVQNPTIEIEYEDAKAGMRILDIKEKFDDADVDSKNFTWRTVYYLKREDEAFLYYFISIGTKEEPTILYIMKKE